MPPIPQAHRFRLRFRLAKAFDSPLHKHELIDTGLSRPATLLADDPDKPIGNSEWLTVQSRGYPSEDEARKNGNRLKDALLLSGAQCGIGIDVGRDNVTSGVFQPFKDAFFNDTGRILRNSVHGLDVFEDVEASVFRSGATLTVTAGLDGFLHSLTLLAPLAGSMDERSRTSAQLINDADFPLTPEARLVVLMTAIESLWEAPRRSGSISALTDSLLLHLQSLKGSEFDKEEVRRRVEGIRTSSIGSFCRGKISSLLGWDRVGEFDRLYQARSRFVHHGRGRATLHAEADLARRLAIDTLLAVLRSRTVDA